MQIYPLEFAEEVINIMMPKTESIQPDNTMAEGPTGPTPAQQSAPAPPLPAQSGGQPYASASTRQYHPENVNIQPAQFQGFDPGDVMQQKENIEIIMDVPLEVSVELGRTNKKIREILEFSPGSVIELDKQAGEPIDILVNGKFVAKGEVVVIDENFGIRITDIISPDKRI
ncbi:MAG: flagellar motor switch protein FliN, partial [Defluviitaleaceae bacterium]|nr:flagellar motor switch protein FliN [Defluviitaleaceae bacterium]